MTHAPPPSQSVSHKQPQKALVFIASCALVSCLFFSFSILRAEPAETIDVPPHRISVYFSPAKTPAGSAQEAIVSMIDKATKDIRVMAYRATPQKPDKCVRVCSHKETTMGVRKKHTAAFKAKVALAALMGDKTIAELSSEYGVHQTQINAWKRQLKDSAVGIFNGNTGDKTKAHEKEIHTLHAKIGKLTVERDFLANAWEKR